MARVLTGNAQRREPLHEGREPEVDYESAPLGASAEVYHPWFGCPVTHAERSRVSAAAVPFITARIGGERDPRRDGARHIGRLLDWLEDFPGVSYQDRWEAAISAADPADWCPELKVNEGRRLGARLAINALILLGVIRPDFEWMFVNKQVRFYRDWVSLHDPALGSLF